MGFVKCLRGVGSGVEYAPDKIMNLCPVDDRPVEIVLDLDRIKAERANQGWYHPERKDMWRFGALLPLDIDNPVDLPSITTLGEGYTPSLAYDDYSLAKKAGFRFEIKEEGAPHRGFGANPTRSFKDRGMAMTVSMARKLGLNRLAIPTQGNAGDSLAEYGRAAAMELIIAMPDDTPMSILGRVAAIDRLDDRIALHLVRGTIREAGAWVKEHAVPQGYFSVATFQEPGWRIEGKKTMGLELAEPREGSSEWRLPDVIIYPTGGGTGILGMWKAFDELEGLGLIGPERPKIVSVQSTETAPIVEAFEKGAADTKPVNAGKTLCTGLNVPGGVGHFKVLEILYKSGGTALAIDENTMSLKLSEIYREKGWWISPEGAAAVATLKPLLERGLIQAGNRVVAFNTGSFEKYLHEVRHLLKGNG